MFVDFLTLVMINLVAGSGLVGLLSMEGMDEKDQRPYAAAFFVTGLVGMITGLQLSFTWPLPGSFNVGYGDASTLFGVVFMATAIALWQGWNLIPFPSIPFSPALMPLSLAYASIPCNWGRNLLWPP